MTGVAKEICEQVMSHFRVFFAFTCRKCVVRALVQILEGQDSSAGVIIVYFLKNERIAFDIMQVFLTIFSYELTQAFRLPYYPRIAPLQHSSQNKISAVKTKKKIKNKNECISGLRNFSEIYK
jgi:hypothetical protein